VAQVAEHLPREYQALSPTPHTAKKNLGNYSFKFLFKRKLKNNFINVQEHIYGDVNHSIVNNSKNQEERKMSTHRAVKCDVVRVYRLSYGLINAHRAAEFVETCTL
jgi:hypothetical protein